MPDRPQMPGFERLRADTGSFARPDLWQQQSAPRCRPRPLTYELVLWPAVGVGAVLGSYLRQWAPPQPGVLITVASLIACVAVSQVGVWLVFTIIDLTRPRRGEEQHTERFAVADVDRLPRHRRDWWTS